LGRAGGGEGEQERAGKGEEMHGYVRACARAQIIIGYVRACASAQIIIGGST